MLELIFGSIKVNAAGIAIAAGILDECPAALLEHPDRDEVRVDVGTAIDSTPVTRGHIAVVGICCDGVATNAHGSANLSRIDQVDCLVKVRFRR